MPEELIQQEYFCDFSAANVGSFYGPLLAAMERKGLVGQHFDSGRQDVFTNWDLGRTDDTAIWWWRPTPEGVDVLDHYASHGEDLEHYFHVLDTRAERHGWCYRKHFLPHDARAKTLATKVSVQDQFLARYGASQVAVGPALSLKDGIAAVRRLLGRTVRFHARCALSASPKDCDGVDALRSYHRTWDAERKCFSETPVHDWSSHTADSFRYLALCAEAVADMTRQPAPKPQPRLQAMHEITLDEAWDSGPDGTGRIG
jgi:hypothetical protein